MIRRILRSQKGFTLIELLVAVGILAVLAGIAVPVVMRFTTSSQQKAAIAEEANIQSLVDSMMADKLLIDLSGLTLPASPTLDMTIFPCTEYPLAPDYIREAPKCTYSVDTQALVTQGTCTW